MKAGFGELCPCTSTNMNNNDFYLNFVNNFYIEYMDGLNK